MRNYVIALIMFFAASTGYSLTVTISGTITNVNDPFNIFGGTIAAGDSFSGSYTYDDTPDTVYTGTDLKQYLFTTGMNGVSIEINGLIFATNFSNTNFLVEIHNDRASTNDVFLWHSYANTALSSTDIGVISWYLHDNSRTALSSTDLPNTAMDLSDWPDFNFLQIENSAGISTYYIDGEVTVTEAVPAIPEPLSLVLCTISIVFLSMRKIFV